MNKSEFRQWRRRLRAEARRRRMEQMNDPHRGSYNNTIVDPGTLWKNYDEVGVTRTLNHGDFHSTTPYSIGVSSRLKNNCVRFAWYKDSTKTSGFTAVGLTPELASWWGGYSQTSSKRSALITAAQAALVAKVDDGVQQWDILTDLAEAKETVSTLKSTASWFYELARLVRRRSGAGILQHLNIHPTRKKVRYLNRKIMVYRAYTLNSQRAVDVFSTMSNLWMTYRYGFMPMIYSMRDAFAAFTANPDLLGLTKKFQVTLNEHVFYQPTYSQMDNGSGLLWTPSKSYSFTGSIRHQAFVSFTAALKARLGLTSFSSLLRTAWEVVPYSWVLDWFTGIGAYLQGLGLEDLVPNSAVNSTEKGYTRIWGSFSYSSKTGWRHVPIAFQSGGESRYFYFRRWKGNLSSAFVGWNPWFNFKRSLDSACLSWQHTKKYIHS